MNGGTQPRDEQTNKFVPRQLYRSEWNSMGALLNDYLPEHINQIILLCDAVEQDQNAIIPLRNKLRTLMYFLQLGLFRYDLLETSLNEVNQLIDDWKKNNRSMYPLLLKDKLLTLAKDFFYQYHRSGVGILFTKVDTGRDKKVYDAIVGNS